MSFKTREIMTDVFPAARQFRRDAQGFALCGEATRNDEDDDLDCGEATRPGGGTPANRPEADLALLRRELRQALAPEMTP